VRVRADPAPATALQFLGRWPTPRRAAGAFAVLAWDPDAVALGSATAAADDDQQALDSTAAPGAMAAGGAGALAAAATAAESAALAVQLPSASAVTSDRAAAAAAEWAPPCPPRLFVIHASGVLRSFSGPGGDDGSVDVAVVSRPQRA